MKLYLSSFKLGNKIEVLKDWIKSNENKIALIPNSRDLKEKNEEEKEKILGYAKLLQDIGFDVEIIDLKDFFDNKKELNNEMKRFSAFCVVGGNVFVLRAAMYLSGFDKFLIENKNKNLLYIGWSAGSCVLSKSLKGLNLVDEPINPYNNDGVIYEGVGFLEKLFVPHYKSNHKESDLIDNVIEYCKNNNIEYDALHDGEVIIKEI